MSDWLQKYPPESIVQKAYVFASNAHEGVERANGEPYINHPIAAAYSVKKWGLDDATIAAALLHDVAEDTNYTLQDIENKFGKEIAFLVNGLTKLEKIEYSGDKAQAENIRKTVLAFSEDLRVVFIKLADRLHNMQTLSALPPENQKRIALETSEIYAPLAYRLGMQKLSGELEDLAFPYLHPKEYEWLFMAVESHFNERQKYAETVKPIVEKKLKEHNIVPLAIDSRAKRHSSLYKKLLRYEMDLGKIYDLVALRIILPNVADCYAALGIIHKFWPPLPNQFDDYIARPKPNGYRSLHTTVFCVDNKITEFQIRTQDMHEEAELGIAAHFAYSQIKHSRKEYESWKGVKDRKELLGVSQLREWQKNFTDPQKFLESLKVDFFKDRIFVITPKNEVIDLPLGATPIDFAYRIHSEIGDGCIGAKINNKIVSLNYELRSGDLVEIMMQKGKKPSESWLEFVKTSLAQDHIKTALRAKNKIFIKKTDEAPSVEFKITIQNRQEFLKDLTQLFHQMKINIISLHTTNNPKASLPIVLLKCDLLEQSRLEKVMFKIKQLNGVKEINYKFNR